MVVVEVGLSSVMYSSSSSIRTLGEEGDGPVFEEALEWTRDDPRCFGLCCELLDMELDDFFFEWDDDL